MADDINTQVEDEHEDIMDAMINGTFNPDTEADSDNEEVTQEEDTDQNTESDEEEELDEAGDGELDEDSETEDEDEEENTLVDEDSSEEDVDEEDTDGETEDENLDDAEEPEEDDEADVATEDETDESEDPAADEDDTDTEDEADVADSETTDEIDYKKFYEDVAMGDITVNGKKVKKFTDPQKIIQSIQMAGGFSEKMAGFKKYRPFTSALKERGMLESPEKFDLAMNLIDGDTEAIKQHLKNLGVNPIDIEMDDINYTGKTAVSSQESIALEDTMELARTNGVEDRMRQVIGSEWDDESFNDFVSNSAIRSDLLNHMSTGAYDDVQGKIQEIKLTDVNGMFSSMKSVDQYREAVKQLQAEQTEQVTQQPVVSQAPTTKEVRKTNPSASTVKAEKAKIAEQRRKAEYAEKAKAEEKKVADRRRKAAAVSKKKPKAKPKKAFDPMELEGDDFDNLMDELISSGRR